MKPNIKFLRKVAEGGVSKHNGYSPARGCQVKFYGGEATAQRHADAGYIVMPDPPRVMHSTYAELTDKAREVLAEAEEAE